MARKKKTETMATQTPDSLADVAVQLANMAKELTSLVDILRVDPAVETVEVPYDRSKRDGLDALRTWINGARKAGFDKRYKVRLPEQKPSVSVAAPDGVHPRIRLRKHDRK